MLNAELQAHYNDFSHRLSDDALETWADLFCDDATYRLTSRRNHERQLPLCTMLCESRGALIDRIAAIRNTLVYAPRKVLHSTSNVQVVTPGDDEVQARTLFVVFQTFETGVTELQMVGRSFDTWRRQGERLKLLRRDAIYDTELVPGSIVYPA